MMEAVHIDEEFTRDRIVVLKQPDFTSGSTIQPASLCTGRKRFLIVPTIVHGVLAAITDIWVCKLSGTVPSASCQ
jgi:hypothetical protein